MLSGQYKTVQRTCPQPEAILPVLPEDMTNLAVVLLVLFLFYANKSDCYDAPKGFEGFVVRNGIEDPNAKEFKQMSSPMWFGPRIGRKKRNPDDPMEKPATPGGVFPWLTVVGHPSAVIIAVNETGVFTPRMGRELDDYRLSVRNSGNSNIHFEPRMGRTTTSFTYWPRLGREIDEDLPLGV